MKPAFTYDDYMLWADQAASRACKTLTESTHVVNGTNGQAWATLALAYVALAEAVKP